MLGRRASWCTPNLVTAEDEPEHRPRPNAVPSFVAGAELVSQSLDE
ncbi:hypothetical protein [Haladaptatus halobius]|nr:hypothetical protein [Haladaptatus halobius]